MVSGLMAISPAWTRRQYTRGKSLLEDVARQVRILPKLEHHANASAETRSS